MLLTPDELRNMIRLGDISDFNEAQAQSAKGKFHKYCVDLAQELAKRRESEVTPVTFSFYDRTIIFRSSGSGGNPFTILPRVHVSDNWEDDNE